MLRTFNYTDRRKILQDEVEFSLEQSDEGYTSFVAEFKLKKEEFPDHAKVYVKAKYKETMQRFNFGRVSNIIPPAHTNLRELDLSGTVQFEVNIVDESEDTALILASGSGFRHKKDNDKGRESLMAVKAYPMDGLSWKVDFDEADSPELVVNSKIPNAIEKMRADPVFQALVLPTAMQVILTKYLLSEDSDIESDAYIRWLHFAKMFSDDDPSEMDTFDKQAWIDNVTHEFAKKFDFSTRLIDTYKDED